MITLRNCILALSFFAASLMPVRAYAGQLQPDSLNLPEDYVVSSVMYASPGGALYSKAGHIAIRLQCPEHKLDYVFSYESEDASRKVLSFLGGELKMGLIAIPSEEYLSNYRKDGRGVQEYPLNMPLKAKQNLWRILDNHCQEGMDLSYDYIERGCALSTVHFLKEGLDTIRIEYGPWPEYFSLTRRELTERQLGRFPWTWSFMYLIGGKPIDDVCSREEKIIMPADFIDVMSKAKINGVPLLGEPRCVLSPENETGEGWFTPVHLALLILFLTLFCAWKRNGTMDYALLAIQTGIGLVCGYLVFFSSLCCTEWNWLLVPFNILPLIFWKWRRYWRVPFGIICAAWALVMVFLPHKMTGWEYIILSVSLSISYLVKHEK